jgi:PAS domain S-box-containing protein
MGYSKINNPDDRSVDLQQGEDKYRLLFEHVHDGIYQSTIDGKILTANPALVKMLGYESEEELKLMNIAGDIYVNASERDKYIKHLSDRGNLEEVELILKRKDGSHIVVLEHSHIIRNAEGEELYYEGTLTDITERKRSAEEMRLHLKQLRQIIDLVPSYIFAKDVDGQFLLVNKALAEVFGIDPEAIKGKTDKDYGATREQIEGYRSTDLAVIEGGVAIQIPEEQVLRKDGTLGWFQTVKIPYSHPGWEKPAILGVATEITERKEIEDELRRSEKRFRQLFESHTAVKLLIDPELGIIVGANNAAAEFYCWPVGRLRKMRLSDLCFTSAEEMITKLEKVKKNRGIFFESTHILADESVREVEIFCSRIEVDGKFLIHAIIHDITEKKKILNDLIVAKERAEESDRLKTAFLHNISHEIRTPMNAIVGFTSLLESSGLSEETRRQYIDIVYQSSNQLLSIITDIVDISNIETGHTKMNPQKVDINAVIRKLYDQFLLRAKQVGISFKISPLLDDSQAVIISDEIKLIQVLSNLLNNSFKFTGNGSIEFGYILVHDILQFYVKDTGMGISEGNLQKIFERFYQVENTSSQKTGGTGLGLSISKAYVELMGGKIWVDSTPGEGSTFYFTIPYFFQAT